MSKNDDFEDKEVLISTAARRMSLYAFPKFSSRSSLISASQGRLKCLTPLQPQIPRREPSCVLGFPYQRCPETFHLFMLSLPMKLYKVPFIRTQEGGVDTRLPCTGSWASLSSPSVPHLSLPLWNPHYDLPFFQKIHMEWNVNIENEIRLWSVSDTPADKRFGAIRHLAAGSPYWKYQLESAEVIYAESQWKNFGDVRAPSCA
ncbi:hypothetical protein ACTXT7_014688 [Hymenolepis weldensis]